MPIRNYKDRATEDIAKERRTKATLKKLPVHLHAIAFSKLIFLDNSFALKDLQNWKSLRLEKLKGNRNGQYSIRINDQFRICFVWIGTEAMDVEITDYH